MASDKYMTNILFGVIGLLMFAITGIGFAEVRVQMEEKVVAQAPAANVASAAVSVTGDSSTSIKSRVETSASSEDESQSQDTVVRALSDVMTQVTTTISSSAKEFVFGSDDNDTWDDEGSYRDEDEYEDENEDEDEDEREHRSTSSAKAVVTTSAPVTTATKTNTAVQTNTPQAGTFTMAQVASHNSAASCYSVVSGAVYDLTSYVAKHPGGQSAIKSICGVDGTAGFSGQHAGQSKPTNTLAQFKIGVLTQ